MSLKKIRDNKHCVDIETLSHLVVCAYKSWTFYTFHNKSVGDRCSVYIDRDVMKILHFFIFSHKTSWIQGNWSGFI